MGLGEDSVVAPVHEVEQDSGTRSLQLILEVRAQISRLESMELAELSRFAAYRDDLRSAVAELALTLSESESAMRNKVVLANSLNLRLPSTFDALASGDITAHKASKIADATDALSDELAREVDERMRDKLAGKNAGALRQAVVRQIHHVDPDGAEHRRQRRRAQRKVELLPGTDGMTTLFADIPAEAAQAAYTRIDRDARALRKVADPRTMDQLRADVLIDLLLGDATRPAGPRAEIFVHTAATTLAGHDDLPGEIEGYGPVTAQLVRQLATSGSAVLREVHTEPRTGTVTHVGRTRHRPITGRGSGSPRVVMNTDAESARYRPSAAVDDLVRVRDRHCRMPGCHRPAHTGDLDHVRPFAKGGPTIANNLIGLCRNHHRLKDHPGWSYEVTADGELAVATPTGARHTSSPEPLHPSNVSMVATQGKQSCSESRVVQGDAHRRKRQGGAATQPVQG